jgi:hypothetical protein
VTLKYGETPWDRMSQEELLLVVWKMWATIVEAESVIRLNMREDWHPFWSEQGSGGRTLEMIHQVRADIGCEHGTAANEELYRAFFRYAPDLLFDRDSAVMVGSGWRVCDKDGDMYARLAGDPAPTKCHKCGGPLRRLEWKDLRRP